MFNVLLVRSGTRYGPEYVTALSRQIREQNDARIVTLTDQDDTPGETRELVHAFPGWWSKLELFAVKDLLPALYIDLDSFVFGPLDDLVGGNVFKMVRDFNDWTPANSSVMWIPDWPPPIWTAFIQAPQKHMDACGMKGDQHFLGDFCEAHWEPVESGITSYKRHGKDGPAGVVMTFHGRPKMADVKGGWVAERWAKYAKA